MALKKIRDDLYKRDSQYAKRRHVDPLENQWSKKGNTHSESSMWARTKDSLAVVRMTATLWASLIVLSVFVISALAYGYVRYQQTYFSEAGVLVTFEAPENIPSNRSFEGIVRITNNNRADLKNTSLSVRFDEYFRFEESEMFSQLDDRSVGVRIAKVASGQTIELTLIGQYIAPQDEVGILTATFDYESGLMSETYQKKASTSLAVTSSPITVDIIAPGELSSGDLAQLRILYRNDSAQVIPDINMEVSYPSDFIFQGAEPEPVKQDGIINQNQSNQLVWSLGTLSPGQGGEVNFRGILQGGIDDIRSFTTSMSTAASTNSQRIAYSQDQHNFRIVRSPLTIIQSTVGNPDNVVSPNEKLEYIVAFQNTSSVPLRNIILTAFLEDENLLDYSELIAGGDGFFDLGEKSITWKAVNIPSLAILNPGQSGSVRFSVPIKERVSVSSTDDKNFTISSRVVANSPDFPDLASQNKNAISNTLVSKVDSKKLLQSSVARLEGPFPLQVNEPTTFQVTLQAGSVNNALGDVALVGNLASGVRIISQQEQSQESFTFNDRTNQFVWNIGSVQSATGVLSPYREVNFEIEVNSSVNQNTTTYIQDLRMRGQDLFTEKNFQLNGGSVGKDNIAR